jgi:threonine aldolase
MILFNCDYNEGAPPDIMKRLIETNCEQTPGYGEDHHCERARMLIKSECGRDDIDVHFLVGGTQTNLTIISAALRPHQGVLCADTGHINVHESGAVEAVGHKVIALRSPGRMPSGAGKITAGEVRAAYEAYISDEAREHTVQPKLVYISQPTELGTVYTKAELEELYETCRSSGLYLYIDGARLGYALASAGCDLTLPDIARLCDAFYIGGTKVGALFGEAAVISSPALKEDFRCIMKQKGGMLAKGRLLGIQFEVLFEDGLYGRISAHAINMADRIRCALIEAGIRLYVDSPTNQLFPVFPDGALAELRKKYLFTHIASFDGSAAVRICTGWATRPQDADALIRDIMSLNCKL